jgi:anthranilate synthase component 2
VFDNYDSFTYNLVHLVQKITHAKVEVHRNDKIALDKVKEFDKIILSPGPGIPSEAGELLALIKEYAASKPILGVCLGHQAIGEVFGGRLVNLSEVYHGISSTIDIEPLKNKQQRSIFKGLPDAIEVGRYHSWIVSKENFPDDLEITARDKNDLIMALQHKTFDVTGVQFHPESILTPDGETIMRNWLKQ